MNLLLIDCNKGKPVDNGFRHTVFSFGNVNGNPTREVLASVKFNSILTEVDQLVPFRTNPKEFLAGLESE